MPALASFPSRWRSRAELLPQLQRSCTPGVFVISTANTASLSEIMTTTLPGMRDVQAACRRIDGHSSPNLPSASDRDILYEAIRAICSIDGCTRHTQNS